MCVPQISTFGTIRHLEHQIELQDREIKNLRNKLRQLEALNSEQKNSKTTCIGCEHLVAVKRVEGAFFLCKLHNQCPDRKQRT